MSALAEAVERAVCAAMRAASGAGHARRVAAHRALLRGVAAHLWAHEDLGLGPADPALAPLVAALRPCPSPLGALYEELLEADVTWEAGGQPRVRWSKTRRKGTGSFYSPAALTVPTVRRTLAPLLDQPSPALRALRICDPSVGGGSFLVAALDVLTEAILAREADEGLPADPVRVRRHVATQCLFGVDNDPLAVEVAQLTLWLALGDPAVPPGAFAHTLRCGDALVGITPEQAATAPTGALRGRPGADTAMLRRLRREVRGATQATTQSCDLWCAVWFWPDVALHTMPTDLDAPSPAALAQVASLQRRLRFFHWPLAFPAVFAGANPGFDAVVGNPPWEIEKPDSREFFAQFDADYPRYGKQQALAVQRALLAEDPAIRRAWQDRRDEHRRRGAFLRATYQHQGAADRNAYKLFVERALGLLREGGQLGLVVPSGLYTDKGCGPLRRRLLETCSWRWLAAFENRHQLFAIEGRFKFCVLVAEKGGRTHTLRAAFGYDRWDQWATGRDAMVVSASFVRAVSPAHCSVPELRGPQDLDALQALVDRGVRADDPSGWGVRYSRELDMTNDAGRFVPADQVRAEPGSATGWVTQRGEAALPLVQGVLLGPRLFNRVAYQGGRSLRARWSPLPPGSAAVAPQFYVRAADVEAVLSSRSPRVGFRPIARTTDARTLVSALIPPWPCGNSVGLLSCRDERWAPALCAVVSSLVFDWQLRLRQSGSNVNWFLLAESTLPPPACTEELGALLLALHPQPWFDALRAQLPPVPVARSAAQRLRIEALLDAIVAVLYGVTDEQLAWMLRECAHPVDALRDRAFCRSLDPRGFWRLGRRSPPEDRLPVRVLGEVARLRACIAREGNRDAGVRAAVAGITG